MASTISIIYFVCKIFDFAINTSFNPAALSLFSYRKLNDHLWYKSAYFFTKWHFNTMFHIVQYLANWKFGTLITTVKLYYDQNLLWYLCTIYKTTLVLGSTSKVYSSSKTAKFSLKFVLFYPIFLLQTDQLISLARFNGRSNFLKWNYNLFYIHQSFVLDVCSSHCFLFKSRR